ncbi:MAG: SDR family NAD(P)-dependent oxidoreductase [Magnetospirillum sp.]
MRGLSGKVVIVTGGAGGIGKATCCRFSEEGAKVAIVDLNLEAATATAAELSAKGGTVKAYGADLTDLEAVTKAVAAIEAELGPVDVLVNNAGWDLFSPFLKSTPDYWRKIIDINLVGVLNITHTVLKGFVERKAGKVVSLASDAARVGSSGEAVYAAAKAGVIAFSKTLAREHAREGIVFNVVCPGVTDTPLLQSFMEGAGDPEKLRVAFTRAVPLGRLGQPSDLPGAIAFFASDDAAFITGQVISVSGGLTMNG